MSRRRRAEVREIQADPVYNSTLAEKFINSMMWDGKKTTAQNIFYGAMEKIGERAQDELSSSSRKRSKTPSRCWKSRLAVSAARTIRFRSRFRRTGGRLSRSAGF